MYDNLNDRTNYYLLDNCVIFEYIVKLRVKT